MKKLRKRTTLYAFLFLTAAICLMVTVMLRRDYATADDSKRLFDSSYVGPGNTPVESDGSANKADAHGYQELRFIESDALDAPTVFLPLPNAIHFEDVTFENHYLEHTLAIRIQTDNPAFVENLEVTARAGILSDVRYMYDKEAQLLTIAIVANSLMEFFPVYTNDADFVASTSYSSDADFRGDNDSVASTDYHNSNAVVVTCQSPTALYDNIIVIDPIYSLQSSNTFTTYESTDGTKQSPHRNDAALMLAQEMQAQASALGNGTRIYITRTDKNPPEKDQIFNLIHESGAVKYLALMLPEGAVSLRASAYFNDRFYIRGYGNLQLAADSEQALSVLKGITLTGVYATDQGSDVSSASDTAVAEAVLNTLKIPGALLRIDGLSPVNNIDSEQISQAAAALLSILK